MNKQIDKQSTMNDKTIIKNTHSSFKFPLKVRMRDNRKQLHNAQDFCITKKIATENSKFKKNLNQLEILLNKQKNDQSIFSLFNPLIEKYQKQLKSKDVKIDLLNKQLNLVLAHLPQQMIKVNQDRQISQKEFNRTIHSQTPKDIKQKSDLSQTKSFMNSEGNNNYEMELLEIKQFLVKECPLWILLQANRIYQKETIGVEKINIMETLSTLIEGYSQKSSENLQMQEYIEELKRQLSEKQDTILKIEEQNRKKRQNFQYHTNLKCQELENMIKSIEQQFLANSSQLSISKQMIESQKSYEDILQEHSYIKDSQSEIDNQDTSQLKKIFKCAERSIQKYKIQNARIEKMYDQFQNQRAEVKELEDQLVKIKQFLESQLNIKQTYQFCNSQKIINMILQIIENKQLEQYEKGVERQDSIFTMICNELDSIFSETLFKNKILNSLGARLSRMKQVFADKLVILQTLSLSDDIQKIECLLKENQQLISQQLSGEAGIESSATVNKLGGINVPQIKIYLSELEKVIKQLKLKNAKKQMLLGYEQQKNEKFNLELRSLLEKNRVLKQIFEDIADKLKNAEHIQEIEEIAQEMGSFLFQEQQEGGLWQAISLKVSQSQPKISQFEQQQFISKQINSSKISKIDKFNLKTLDINLIKYQYFSSPPEFINQITDKLQNVLNCQEIENSIRGIFETLKEKDRKKVISDVNKKQNIKSISNFILDLCQRGVEDNFADELKESHSLFKNPKTKSLILQESEINEDDDELQS